MSSLKIGLFGLDTSHAPAFTRLLNDATDENHVEGGKVVAAFPGGNPHWDKSADRVEGFTNTIRDDFGVTICDTPEKVAEQVDMLIINAVDGRQHRDLFEKLAPYQKPTFIDKPFSASVEDAKAMIELADKNNITLMSSSALRYAVAFTEKLNDDSLGAIKGIDVFGPMALEDALPGLFWYGCHSVEMIETAMGSGCKSVRATVTEGADQYTFLWGDGRIATLRGTRDGHPNFGATIHREKGFQTVDIASGTVPFYASLLKAVFANVPNGKTDVPHAQMLEVIAMMEAGNQARESGEVVEIVK